MSGTPGKRQPTYTPAFRADAVRLVEQSGKSMRQVANDVIDKTSGPGWTSAVFDQAENRLHVEKAVMALLMH